jgi:hypothetical protein
VQFSRSITLLFFCLTGTLAAQDLETIVASMERAQEESRALLRPYTSTRQYVVTKSGDERGAVRVAMKHVPPDVSFQIVDSTGGMPEKAVRKALEKEAQLARSPELAAVTRENYEFQLVGREFLNGADCHVLTIKPHKRSKDLLNGRIWVDAQTYRVRRVQGEVSKSPSFWVKSLDLILNFANVDGMWLKVSSEAMAHIRWAGDYKLLSYDSGVRVITAPVQVTKRHRSSHLRRATASLAAAEPVLHP